MSHGTADLRVFEVDHSPRGTVQSPGWVLNFNWSWPYDLGLSIIWTRLRDQSPPTRSLLLPSGDGFCVEEGSHIEGFRYAGVVCSLERDPHVLDLPSMARTSVATGGAVSYDRLLVSSLSSWTWIVLPWGRWKSHRPRGDRRRPDATQPTGNRHSAHGFKVTLSTSLSSSPWGLQVQQVQVHETVGQGMSPPEVTSRPPWRRRRPSSSSSSASCTSRSSEFGPAHVLSVFWLAQRRP